MHVIENPEEFRQKISKKLENILNDETKIAENLEKGIYNFCIKEAGERNIVKKWDNVHFTQLYLDRLRTVYINIQKGELKTKILKKEIKAHEIAFMTHQEMIPEKWVALIEKKAKEDENRYEVKIKAATDTFT